MMVSMLFLTLLIILYAQFTTNLSAENKVLLEKVVFDAEMISETLISGGYPDDWNADNVQRLGLTDNNYRLNTTKLGYVANLSYFDRKYLFGTTFDYYIALQYMDGSLLNITNMSGFTTLDLNPEGGIGLYGLETMGSTNPDHMVKKERYLIYNSSTIKLLIFLWT